MLFNCHLHSCIIFDRTKGKGNRPPNLTPYGAGRNGAFRQAKRNSGIPVSKQPKKVSPAVDRRGNNIPGREYDFGNGKIIREHSGGHQYPDDPTQNRGPHFNDVNGEHYDYNMKRRRSFEILDGIFGGCIFTFPMVFKR